MSLSSLPLSLLLFFTVLLSNPPPSSSQQQHNISSFSFTDSPWLPNQNQILLSPNSSFAAGFQPLTTSSNLYTFSVWYNNISVKTTVWSANDKSPVNLSATLVITRSGELRLSNSPGENLWPSRPVGNRSTIQLILQDNGNLIYGHWQSFAYPTNTILPNQQINGTTLSSNNGKFKFVDSKQLVFGRNDSYWTSNNGNAFLNLDDDGRVSQDNGDSFLSADFGESRLRKLTLDEDGNLRLYGFFPNVGRWIVGWQAIQEVCTIHGTCGPNSICVYDGSNSTSCICPPGFRRLSDEGQVTCERKIPLKDQPESSTFLRLDYVNFTQETNQTNPNVNNFSICEAKCLADLNCQGFGFKYDGSGYCVQLYRLLYGYWSPGTEIVTFFRIDISETDKSNFNGMTDVLETTCPIRISLPSPPEESNTTTRNTVIVCTLFAIELIGGAFFFWSFLKKYIKYRDMARTLGLEHSSIGGPKGFSYAEIKIATNNFSNLIGRGGFGDVYKGELSDHRVVAVKCLKNVTGGDAEFWAEVTIVARMHHLNLVTLWGFCAEKGRRILVYEYVPNGSLNKFLFQWVGSSDSEHETDASAELGRKPILDWNIRYRIALGVARAIAYLHEECLEWVLHCDIKPENILLGDDFCPKISDFGLSKLKKKQDIVNKSRIRGTPGYVAPEWVKMDQITPKADVYSFGMVLLEIVTGFRNNAPAQGGGSKMESEDWYFPGWAFDKVFKEMKVEDILDQRIKASYDSRAHFDMVNRMVKTAMWCLQHRPETRPSMGKVAKMLEGTVEIMEPEKPTIFFLVQK